MGGDNTDIKPIETIYNGYRFRSRLEARWAVFFDTAGIKYQYETEGFYSSVGDSYYLPDFYFPESDCYGEVKGKPFTKEEKIKMAYCMDYNSTPLCSSAGLLFFGNIPNENQLLNMYDFTIPYCFYYKGINGRAFGFTYDNCKLVIDPIKSILLKQSSAPDFPFDDAEPMLDQWSYDGNIKKYIRLGFTLHCLDVARQARFEHGEKPMQTNMHKYSSLRELADALKTNGKPFMKDGGS